VAVSRRLSQEISEGDGISIIVRVDDAAGARAAEDQGAKAVAFGWAVDGIRDATSLPLLWVGGAPPRDADAVAIRPDSVVDLLELEAVVDVRDDDELEAALEEHDPEIFLLSLHPEDDREDALESVLELLPDVPAGKLAIADVDVVTRYEVLALERAGFDAVLVPPGDIAGLVGHSLPDV
jgi:hypothetical protein